VTARVDQLSPEQVLLAKGLVAGSANLALGLLVGADFGAFGADRVLADLHHRHHGEG